MSKKEAPISIPLWEDADAYAIQALERGEATPEQQKRAITWIVNEACQTYGFCMTPENDRLSAIFDGRRFAGLQIVKLVKINLSILKENRRQAEEINKQLAKGRTRHAR
jgi:hypothetical protein